MAELSDTSPLLLERSCALTAVALSGRHRQGARLITGLQRGFGLSASLSIVLVPYPAPHYWTRRTLTCGVALQCSPSKDRLAQYRLTELSPRELCALTLVEAGVALGWVTREWPGLLPEMHRVLPDLATADPDMDATSMLDRAIELARTPETLLPHPLLGSLPSAFSVPRGLISTIRRFGRMPWTSTQQRRPRPYSVPVGGDGGVRNPNLPPPSRPEDNDSDFTPNRRQGVPYPEWNQWTNSFLPDHVAVVEHRRQRHSPESRVSSTPLQKWFEEHTHRAMVGPLEDGSELDVDSYVSHHLDVLTGAAKEPRVFRALLPSGRDVTTALLLDASSSLGVHGGRIFRLELACADALSRAMTQARERHGIFTFTGNTRHHVEVHCLKDFDDRRFVAPGELGLATGGYTRLGAPVRHLTSRLLRQPSERRLLLVIGDGLMSDEGYEGRYAWADVAHAVEEANEAGVSVYYLGVGPTRVDPLPEVFGPRRSQRIRRVEELPRVLAHVHRELVAA
ncbi:nitric oxide reductase activation protein NorD [Mycobacterium kubicae]|uniref:MorD protein n=1 Tax=Mycobacterium kubicae TaxID=120959 RepID=A0AAX1J9S3_9MYCO|nr:MorD protein [Mycobacterium kubicae]MCV7096201.1 MorD protein [Mycobacterium kubicae]ORV95647.1 MorD protein [Mycobacterium kubicae]QNI13693.1 MorD protein [Mycobacterium kubicae]QPI37210.1 MorD protein [Mycobacterium kubicae]